MATNIVFDENPYNPFPVDFKGQFCEISENDGTRFFEIHSIPYDSSQTERLKQIGSFEESILGQYIGLVGENNLDTNVFHLYKLQTYKANPLVKDPWDFNESISEYQEFGFIKFRDLINFCADRWGVSEDDFVPIHKTHIPG
jgi:hypothetical protein